MILTLARRDLAGFLLTPFGPILLAFCQLLLAYNFLGHVDNYLGRQADLAVLSSAAGATQWIVTQWLATSTIILLAALPLITMRTLSEEWHSGTMSLLLSSPIASSQIVLGKFLGVCAIIFAIVFCAALMPLSLALGTAVDYGLIGAAMLGLLLLMASFAAVGIYMSSLARQPSTAAFTAFGVLLMLWILDWTVTGDSSGDRAALAYLSLFRHFQPFIQGQLVLADILFFVLVTLLFLSLSVRRLVSQRRFQ